MEGRRWWEGGSPAWAVGSSCQVGLVRGDCISLYSLARQEAHRLLGQELWDGAHSLSWLLPTPCPLASASAPLTDHQLTTITLKGLRAGSFWNFIWELVSSFLSPVGFIYGKAETDGNGNGIVKLNQSLSKQASELASLPSNGRGNGTTSRGSPRPPPCHSGQELCLGSPDIKAQMKLQRDWGHFDK